MTRVIYMKNEKQKKKAKTWVQAQVEQELISQNLNLVIPEGSWWCEESILA